MKEPAAENLGAYEPYVRHLEAKVERLRDERDRVIDALKETLIQGHYPGGVLTVEGIDWAWKPYMSGPVARARRFVDESRGFELYELCPVCLNPWGFIEHEVWYEQPDPTQRPALRCNFSDLPTREEGVNE